MDFSDLGLIGLLVGLAFAVLDYVVVLPLIGAAAARSRREGGGPSEATSQLIRWLFLAQFVVFPVVGYLVGRSLEGWGTAG